MRTIVSKDPIIEKILGKQSIDMTLAYRRLQFIETVEDDGLYLAYNMLTREFIHLTANESLCLSGDHFYVDQSTSELVENWFAIPINNNDIVLYQQLLSLYQSFDQGQYIDNYTIFTTTDCNARCFYCYEKGIEHISMSAQTAHDVADFIKAHSFGRKVNLHWFGGEPLYNMEVIDIITDDLQKSGVVFYSTMISNGYLFDKEIITRAQKRWNLIQVQITLDGTQDVYNKSKNYIYNDQNPFLRVCGNINSLLDNKIAVKIRLNMDSHNEKDLFKLADFLIEHYSGRKKISVYVALLYDFDNKRSRENKKLLVTKILELEEKLRQAGLVSDELGNGKFKSVYCMADNKHSLLVNPSGQLGKCEHYPNDYLLGSIAEPCYETKFYKEWQLFAQHVDFCQRCPYYIECIAPTKCINYMNGCDSFDRYLRETRMKRAMLRSYKKLGAKQNKDDDNH